MKRSILVLPVLLSLPAIAHAQGSAKADALYQEAVELFKSGSVGPACEKLDASFKLEAKTQTLFSLAKCREREGKLTVAVAQFTELVERAQREKQKDKEAQMQAKVIDLGARIPRVTLKLENRPEVTGVTVDGRAIGQAAWSVPVALDPGEHLFVFSGTNKVDVERKVLLKEKDTVTIEIEPLKERRAAIVTPPPSEHNPPPPPGPDLAMPPPRSEGGGHRTLGYILGGVGVASIAGGSIFGVMAIGQKGDADDKFAARDPGFKEADNSASTSALISTILFGVGIAGVAAGAYFVLTSPSKSALVSRVERGALLW